MKLLKNILMLACVFATQTALCMSGNKDDTLTPADKLESSIKDKDLEGVNRLLMNGTPVQPYHIYGATLRVDQNKDKTTPIKIFKLIMSHAKNLKPDDITLEATLDNTIGSSNNDFTLTIQSLLNLNIPVSTHLLKRSIYGNKPKITKLLLQYSDESLLNRLDINDFDLPEDDVLVHFVLWLNSGARTQTLNHEGVNAFTGQAFTMPKLTEEFSQLLPLVKHEELHEVFTQAIIHDALMSHNLKGFELLLPVIAKDRKLVNIIRNELDVVDDQMFVEKIRTLIKNETGKPSTRKGDIKFNFSK